MSFDCLDHIGRTSRIVSAGRFVQRRNKLLIHFDYYDQNKLHFDSFPSKYFLQYTLSSVESKLSVRPIKEGAETSSQLLSYFRTHDPSFSDLDMLQPSSLKQKIRLLYFDLFFLLAFFLLRQPDLQYSITVRSFDFIFFYIRQVKLA